MTTDEYKQSMAMLVEQVITLPGTGVLTREDVQDILACAAQPNAAELLKILVDDYTAAQKMPPKGWWQSVLDFITPITAFANLIIPITSLLLIL